MRVASTPDGAQQAESLLETKGARLTRARIAILSLLLGSDRALTHHDIEVALAKRRPSVDRVTVYRVLEWLTEQGLAHKLSSADRIWRFSAVSTDHDQRHAHFQCNQCGRVVCLEPAVLPRIKLPVGYRSKDIEVTVKGSCAECRK